MSRDDAIRKGQAAQALLESADFNIAIDSVRLVAYRGFANSEPEQKEQRESNYHLLRAIETLTDNLKALRDNAKLEMHKATLEEAEARAKANNQPDED